jgi:hypothetical protein
VCGCGPGDVDLGIAFEGVAVVADGGSILVTGPEGGDIVVETASVSPLLLWSLKIFFLSLPNSPPVSCSLSCAGGCSCPSPTSLPVACEFNWVCSARPDCTALMISQFELSSCRGRICQEMFMSEGERNP